MKKWICIWLCIWLQMINMQASSYCVMSKDGNVIEEENMNEEQSVASISKIMTAIIAIEEGNLSDTWACSDAISSAYGSMIYLKVGQEVSLKSLLYGLMLRSGNDAAVEIAVYIAGSVEVFVQKMNEKATEIGMLHTTFRNPSGLDEEDGGNTSTAYDMALLMRYAMQNDTFMEISGSQYYTSEWNYRWKNKNRLLFDYAYTVSGKTGYTKNAGRTLVTVAQDEGVDSIVVTLRMSDDFTFHEEKHTYVLENYEALTLMEAGSYQIDGKVLVIEEPLTVTLKKVDETKVKVYTHIQEDIFIVEAQIGEQTQSYSYVLQQEEDVE